ncbi:MAG: adaptor protein MecA [Clostridia bacterium]|nr:adaptor protein MecA [Clostridia bacterium]
MKMEPLSSGDLRIWMTDGELCRWGLHPEELKAGSAGAQRAMRRLLGIARQRLPFRSNGNVLVEALPLEGGCLFLFSSPGSSTPTVTLPQIYALESAEAVLQIGQTLSALLHDDLPPASLYRQGDAYVLILYAGLGTTGICTRVLQEFGYRMGEGYAAVSYIEEHSQPITVGNALQRLCLAYGSHSPTPPHPVR